MGINWALFASVVVSIVVMIGLPILLAVMVLRHFKVSWWVVLTGVLTFIGSQVLHIPALSGINLLFQKGLIPVPPSAWLPLFNGVLAGLLAGIFEETARWVGFKILRDKAKPFGSSLALGVGHGGAESIILCILGTAWSLGTVLLYNPGAQIASGASTASVQAMMTNIAAYWAQPWYVGLLPGLERIIALSTQILLSILVWKAVVNRNAWWFVLAILYHTVTDAVAVFLSQIGWQSYLIEGVLLLFMLLNVLLINRFYIDETEAEEEESEEEGDATDDEDEDEPDEEETEESEEEKDDSEDKPEDPAE